MARRVVELTPIETGRAAALEELGLFSAGNHSGGKIGSTTKFNRSARRVSPYKKAKVAPGPATTGLSSDLGFMALGSVTRSKSSAVDHHYELPTGGPIARQREKEAKWKWKSQPALSPLWRKPRKQTKAPAVLKADEMMPSTSEAERRSAQIRSKPSALDEWRDGLVNDFLSRPRGSESNELTSPPKMKHSPVRLRVRRAVSNRTRPLRPLPSAKEGTAALAARLEAEAESFEYMAAAAKSVVNVARRARSVGRLQRMAHGGREALE